MTFNSLFYCPQSQGGPNPEGVRRGCGFLFETLKTVLPLYEMETDHSNPGLENDIRDYQAILNNIRTASNWLKNKELDNVFTLGGDCSIDVSIIDKQNATHGEKLGVIWIDAHADIHVPERSETKYFHGMPIRTLLGEGDAAILNALNAPLKQKQFCYAGIRSIDGPEQEYIDQQGLPVLSAAEVNAGKYDVFLDWVKNSGIKKLHIHFDLDALDPADGISVTYHVPGGIRHAAMKDFLTFLHGQGITVGFTITEYAPEKKNEAEMQKVFELISTILPLPEILAA